MSNIYVGFTSEKNSAKISKPPGGASSDFFTSNPETTPRSMTNHMKSNIFGTPPQYNKVSDIRRPIDSSHTRLFGDVEKSYPGTKNFMKSSIPIGGPITKDENVDLRDSGVEKKEVFKSEKIQDDSASSMMKNKSRVPPGGFSSILW